MVDLHKKFEKRAEKINSKRKAPTPSEVHSDRMRKKLLRGQAPPPEPLYDCNGCSKNCGFSTKRCDEPCLIGRCQNCGQRVRYRTDPERPWSKCMYCRGERT